VFVAAGASVVAGAAAAPVVSVAAGVVASVALVSVVVVVSVAGFDSQEARATAKNRADTFRRFFMVMVSLKNLSETPFILMS
jgi:hypothetical protein